MPTSPAEHLRFYEMEPLREHGAENWYGRAQNFVTVYSRGSSGASWPVENSENEYWIVVVEGTISVSAENGESATVTGPAHVIVPPGRSDVSADGDAVIVRIFAPAPADLAAKCVNNASYDQPHHNVAPLELWPEPADGYHLRVYDCEKLRHGQSVLRSRNIMVNWHGMPRPARDPREFSPHSHDDFEQVSMCVWGKYAHHIRYPWETDSTTWLEDEHVSLDTPSITIMPPPAIHTSQGLVDGNSLIDIFAPPRDDFSVKGLVLDENAEVYPLPERLRAEAAAAAS